MKREAGQVYKNWKKIILLRQLLSLSKTKKQEIIFSTKVTIDYEMGISTLPKIAYDSKISTYAKFLISEQPKT